MAMSHQYGDSGLLTLPWFDFTVPLCNGNGLSHSNAQGIVDRENSAIIKRRYNGGHCDLIGDHASQGFDIIKKCGYMSPAVIQTPSSSKIYRWIATMLGTNTGTKLITCSGTRVDKIKWADLIMYTCNDSTGKNISIVFFKLQETLNRPIYKVDNL